MAGSGEVAMVFTADEAAAWRAIQKLTGQTQRLNDTLGQTKKKGKEANDEFRNMERAISGGIGAVASLVTGYASLASVIGFVNQALEDNKRLSIEAMNTQVQLGKSQGEAVKNMVSLTDAENKQALAAAKGIQQRTKFPSQRALTDAVSAAFSLPGETADRLSSIEAAAPLSAAAPEQLQDLAGGALKIGQATGNKNMRENLSYALQAGAINQIKDPMKVIKNLSPILTSGMITVPKQDKKQAAAEMAALFGVMAGAGGDEMGESTRTFETVFLSKLATLYEKDKSDPGTLGGRIRDIQNNPAKLKRLLKTEFGEAQYKLPMKQLLTKDSDLAKLFESNVGEMGFSEDKYKTTVDRLQNLTPELAMSRAAARTESALDIKSQDTQTGIEGFIASKLPGVLEKSRPSGLGGLLRGSLQENIPSSVDATFGSDKARAALAELSAREEMIQQKIPLPKLGWFETRSPSKLAAMRQEREGFLSDTDKASLQVIREFRATLEELLAKSTVPGMADVAKDIRAASEALQRAANPDYSSRAEAERQHAEAQ